MEFSLVPRPTDARCAYCRTEEGLDEPWTCECGVVLHRACAEELTTCPTVGCSTPTRAPRPGLGQGPGPRPRATFEVPPREALARPSRPALIGAPREEAPEGPTLFDWVGAIVISTPLTIMCGLNAGRASLADTVPGLPPRWGDAIWAGVLGALLPWIPIGALALALVLSLRLLWRGIFPRSGDNGLSTGATLACFTLALAPSMWLGSQAVRLLWPGAWAHGQLSGLAQATGVAVAVFLQGTFSAALTRSADEVWDFLEP